MFEFPQTAAPARQTLVSTIRVASRARRVPAEFGPLSVLYVAYSASRLLASDNVEAARQWAADLLDIERGWNVAFESTVNGWFASLDLLDLFDSYWYAPMHYIVTAVVLIPTAPPRLMDGTYIDVLSQQASCWLVGSRRLRPEGTGRSRQ